MPTLNLADGGVDLVDHGADLVDALDRAAELDQALADHAHRDLAHGIDRVEVGRGVGVGVLLREGDLLAELVLRRAVFLGRRLLGLLPGVEHRVAHGPELALDPFDVAGEVIGLAFDVCLKIRQFLLFIRRNLDPRVIARDLSGVARIDEGLSGLQVGDLGGQRVDRGLEPEGLVLGGSEGLAGLGEFAFLVAEGLGRSNGLALALAAVVGGLVGGLPRLLGGELPLVDAGLVVRPGGAVDDLGHAVCVAEVVEPGHAGLDEVIGVERLVPRHPPRARRQELRELPVRPRRPAGGAAVGEVEDLGPQSELRGELPGGVADRVGQDRQGLGSDPGGQQLDAVGAVREVGQDQRDPIAINDACLRADQFATVAAVFLPLGDRDERVGGLGRREVGLLEVQEELDVAARVRGELGRLKEGALGVVLDGDRRTLEPLSIL